MYLLSFDTDWAPQAVIDDICQLLKEHGMVATFFCTDDMPQIPAEHECALHPNFLKYSHENVHEAVDGLKENYPQSCGTRSHSLHTSSRIDLMLKGKGITYNSNYLLFNVPNLAAFDLSGMTHLPIFFSDDYYVRYHIQKCAQDSQFTLKSLNLDHSGLKVFVFHPIHVFLNTTDFDSYEKVKEHYQNPQKLFELRSEGKGVRTLFLETLAYIKKQQEKTITMKEYCASLSN